MIRAGGACLFLALGGCGGGAERPASASVPQEAIDDWRRVASPADRARLRGWRTAWTVSLATAGQTAEGAAAIARDRVLFDPDRVLPDPLPPAGNYRCRTIKLGRRVPSGPGFIGYGWFRCRVGAGSFAKIDGSQRQSGSLYADTDSRAIFLGTLALGDEARTMDYGRDRSRDVAGVIERIGTGRWRIAFPYPAFESTLDLIELVPGG